jgi:hypothetical protein
LYDLYKECSTKKAAAAIFPARVLSPPGRLTSEFGMGSGVSAWPSQPPCQDTLRAPRTECHSSLLSDKVNRNSASPKASCPAPRKGKGQSPRAIGASWLCSSRCLHRTSIEPLAWWCPYSIKDGRPSLGRGFALRCSQRLSRPRAAFRRCHWRDNRTTVAAFPLVLAY